MRRPSKFRLDRYGVETIYRVGFQDNRWHCREQSWTRSIVPVTGFLKEMFTRRGRSYSKHKETVSLMLQRDEKDAQNLFSTISSGITIDQFFISVLLLVGRKKRGWSACGMSLVTSALLLEVVMKYCLKIALVLLCWWLKVVNLSNHLATKQHLKISVLDCFCICVLKRLEWTLMTQLSANRPTVKWRLSMSGDLKWWNDFLW